MPVAAASVRDCSASLGSFPVDIAPRGSSSRFSARCTVATLPVREAPVALLRPSCERSLLGSAAGLGAALPLADTEGLSPPAAASKDGPAAAGLAAPVATVEVEALLRKGSPGLSARGSHFPAGQLRPSLTISSSTTTTTSSSGSTSTPICTGTGRSSGSAANCSCNARSDRSGAGCASGKTGYAACTACAMARSCTFSASSRGAAPCCKLATRTDSGSR